MALNCKHCGESSYVKNGFSKGKQRYKCRICNRVFSEGDLRERYTIEERIKVLKKYFDGAGMRSIERWEGVSVPLLIHWIRNLGKMVKQDVASADIPDNAKEIEILEMDELFTFYQKKQIKLTYGLLWSETGIKLLISR